MTTSTTKSAFLKGVRDGSPFIVVVIPFAVLFGVVGTEAGLNLAQVMGFSVVVIAGASQFAALALMTENAPTLAILGTALAVNMRMAMYSAALTPHLGKAPMWQRAVLAYFLVDQVYALSAVEYEKTPTRPLGQKVAYFMGVMSMACPFWYAGTLAGALAGTQIPEAFALDFAVPITFLALVAPMLRTGAHITAALVSLVGALTLSFLPYNLGLFIAALAAMWAGAEVERRMVARGTWS